MVQIHWPPADGNRPAIEDGWGTLGRLQDEGKVRFIGVCNFDVEQLRIAEGVRHVESELLSFVRTAVSGLEVEARSASDWESSILQGYEVFRSLRANGGGIVNCDLDAGSIMHSPPR